MRLIQFIYELSKTFYILYEQSNSISNFHLIKNHTTIQVYYRKATMPLVIPGMMGGSDSSNMQEEWMNKLMGKKITEGSSDATVRHNLFP